MNPDNFINNANLNFDGNTFNLKEALNDHEAVMINLWATYCGPCIAEFPEINKVYEDLRLSKDEITFVESNPTESDIAAYIDKKKNNDVEKKMDADLELFKFLKRGSK